MTFLLNFVAKSHQGVCLYAGVNHFFLCPSPPAAHSVEVILAPCSIDVGYFYGIIFLSFFDAYQVLKSTMSRGYPRIKAQSWYS